MYKHEPLSYGNFEFSGDYALVNKQGQQKVSEASLSASNYSEF